MTPKPINYENLLEIIKKNKKGVKIRIENREKANWYDYGFKYCHGEIVNYINPADGDPWDVIFMGYDNIDFKYGEIIYSNQLVGVVEINNGNHKLLFRKPYKRGFSEKRLKRDVNKFKRNYLKQWGNVTLKTQMLNQDKISLATD